jgi:Secretion system C-terminal sorting domain
MRKLLLSLCTIMALCVTSPLQAQISPACGSIVDLGPCVPAVATIPSGTGTWSFVGTYPINSCGFATPGREAIYRFVPTEDGVYFINITGAPGGAYFDYFYKLESAGGCDNTNWIGIDDNNSVGRDAFGPLVAGESYLIMLDPEATGGGTHTFSVCKATVNAPSTFNTCINASLPNPLPANSPKQEHILDANGNLLASFSASTNTIGSISISYYVKSGAVRRDSDNKEYLNRNMTITVSTQPATPMQVKLYFTNAELTTLINEPNDGIADVTGVSDLAVTRTSQTCATSANVAQGGTRLLQMASATYDINASYAQFNVPAFSTFYLHGGLTVLPAELVFAGEQKDEQNLLRWTTSTESNCRGFAVEYSSDGRSFRQIGYVASQSVDGNSQQPLPYIFADYKRPGAVAYYRLKIENRDRGYLYSNVVLLRGEKSNQFYIASVYPNPVQSRLNIVLESPGRDNAVLLISDMAGKTVKQQTLGVERGANAVQLDAAGLLPGVYLVKALCQSGCSSAAVKFIKQ